MAEQLIDAFFEREVRDGHESLGVLCDQLLSFLEKGTMLEITITGFAAPGEGNSSYCLALGSRRVSTIRNELNSFKNGVLIPYINSGNLRFIEISKGDREVPNEVRRQLESHRESIYSPLASRQRRVEVIGVVLTRGK